MAQHSGGAIESFERLPISFRLVNALHSLIFYLKKMVWPHKLVPFYPFPQYISPLDPHYLISGILVLAITGGCLWMVKRGKYLFLIAWSYYLITLLPVLGIIQVGGQAAADRYTYLPSLSPFLLVGIGVAWCWKKISLIRFKMELKCVLFVCVCIVTFFLSYLTIIQIKVWNNSESFWSFVVSALPKAPSEAHIHLGMVYSKKGRLDEAISEQKKALAIDPNLAGAHTNLGLFYAKKDRLDDAISEYKKAIAIDPHHEKAHYNLGLSYNKKGRLDDAISEYKKALAINPRYADARTNLGNVYDKKGRIDEAIAEYKKAIAIDPHHEKAYYNLGLSYYKKGRLDDAIAEYKKALAINPRYADVHNNLGNVYHRKGKFDKAIYEYKQSLAIKHDCAEAHNNLAVAYYSKANYRLAIVHCDKAVKLGYNVNPKFLELLTLHR